MLLLKRRTIYVVSIAFWLFGAFKVLGIAWHAWDAGSSAKIYWAIGAYIFFAVLVFPRVVKKNILEIEQREGELLPWHSCFTPKSWAIMIFMMCLGICIRIFYSNMTFISGFYTGLGIGLISATRQYFQYLFASKSVGK